MIHRLVVLGALVVFWIALWGDASPANVVGGSLAAIAAMTLAPVQRRQHGIVFRPLAAARLTVHFVSQLFVASLVLAWEVVTPRNRINEAVVAVPLRCDHPLIVTLVANSVSLVPGTITLEARQHPPTLYVHVLHLKTVEAARVDIRRLEELAIRALLREADAVLAGADGGGRP
jgi:multicomponent Na+:H+ antiporter subunit E